MEFMGFIAIMILLNYSNYPSKVKKMEAKIKKLERKEKGESEMSKILYELKNKKCKIVSVGGIDRGFEYTILDIDDEWIKFNYINKKGILKTEVMRIEDVEKVDILEN